MGMLLTQPQDSVLTGTGSDPGRQHRRLVGIAGLDEVAQVADHLLAGFEDDEALLALFCSMGRQQLGRVPNQYHRSEECHAPQSSPGSFRSKYHV